MDDYIKKFIAIWRPLLPVVATATLAGIAILIFGGGFARDLATIFLAIIIAGVLKTRSVHIAVVCRCKFCIELLAHLGADVNAWREFGRTPLHYAAAKGYVSIVSALANAGANVNARDRRGWTPVHSAAWQGKAEIIYTLLNDWADINMSDNLGLIPLHIASAHGHPEVISVLLKYRPKLNAIDKLGKTPLDYAKMKWHAKSNSAKEKEYAECIHLLEKAGGKTSAELKAASAK